MSYFEILNALGDGVICVNQENQIVYCNVKAGEILGMAAEKAMHSHIQSVMCISTIEEGSIIMGIIQQVRKTGRSQGLLKGAYFINKLNKVVYVSASVALIEDDSEGSIAISFRDVTKHVQKDKEHDRQKEQLNYILDSLPVGIVIIDDTRQVESSNDYMMDKFKAKERHALIGEVIQCAASVGHQCGINDACSMCPLKQDLLEASTVIGRIHSFNVIRNDQMVKIDLRLTFIPIQESGKSKTMIVFEDVSELIKLKKEITRHKRYLVKHKEDNRLLLEDIGHRIKDPLNKMLQMDAAIPKAVFHSYAHKIMSLFDDLLEIEDIEQGRFHTSEAHFDPGKILEGQVKKLLSTAMDKELELSLDISMLDHEIIKSNEVIIGRIINKLIAHAIENTASGRVLVKGSLHESIFTVKVVDTGFGMSEEMLLTLEDTLPDELKRYELMDYSLLIVKTLTELMNGTFYIKSFKNRGTAIQVDIPTQVISSQKSSVDKKILLIEDDVVHQGLVSRYLDSLGYDVRIADNGEIGLTYYQRETYMCILLDLQMPIMNGFAVIKKIRAVDQDIPIIALTSMSHEDQEKKIMTYGFNEFLSKPINLQKLKKVVMNLNKQENQNLNDGDIYKTLQQLTQSFDMYSESLLYSKLDDIRGSSVNHELNNLLHEVKIAYKKGYYNKAKALIHQASKLEV